MSSKVSDQLILPCQGQGVCALHNSPLPTLPYFGAVVKAETTQIQILALLPLGCATFGHVKPSERVSSSVKWG